MDVAVAARAARPTWLNRRTILGVVLVGISLIGGQSILENAKAAAPVWVVTRDLPGGATLDSHSLRVEHVGLPASLVSTYLPASVDPAGQILTRPLAAGELVPANWIARDSGSSGTRALTVPVDPERAVGGALRPGDLIDMYATFDAGDSRARTVTLVRAVEVVDLVSAAGLVMGDKAVVGITISVTPEEAQRVAFASRSGALDIVRVDGPHDRGSSGVVTGADF